MTNDVKTVHVLGFAGSLREKSLNRAALRAAGELMPEGMSLDIFDLRPIPLFNADVYDAGPPQSVQDFRARIAAADALLIVTPEYNYSLPGVLKNAIDWASRPPDQPLDGKPIGIMGAAAGMAGTARAQYHLRQVCVFVNMLPLNKPEVMIPAAQQKFDEEGRLADETTKDFIRDLLASLLRWTNQLRAG